MNQPTFYLFLLISLKLVAQNNETSLNGTVKSNSLPVENIHILNKRTQKGAISNSEGKFNIYAKLNDTLAISGIQFYTFNLLITEYELANKNIKVELLQRINTLSEIELKTHDLSGNLMLDTKNYVDTMPKPNQETLNFDDVDVKVPSTFVAKKLDPDYLPDPTDPMAPIGGDLIGLANLIFSPLIKVVSEKIEKRKIEKKKERKIEEKRKNATNNIREEFGGHFFINDLNIPTEQIDAFIDYCKSKGTVEAYVKNNKIELINIFVSESKNFNQSNSIQKSK